MLYPSLTMIFGFALTAAALLMIRRNMAPARLFIWLALALALFAACQWVLLQSVTANQSMAWPVAAEIYTSRGEGSWHSSTMVVGSGLALMLAILFASASAMFRLQANKGMLYFPRLARLCAIGLLLPLISAEPLALAAPFLFGMIPFEFAALVQKITGLIAVGLTALAILSLACLIGQLVASLIRKWRAGARAV